MSTDSPQTAEPSVTRGFFRQVTAKNNRFALGIAILAALGGFLFGYDTGIVGGALPLITSKLHLSAGEESWITGSLLLGAVAGAAMSGFLADRIGRKWTLFVAGVIYTGAAIASGLTSSLLPLCIARGVLGLAVGTASFVAPMYIGEHSPKELRGGMTALTQVAITFGILVAYFVADALKGYSNGWNWMFALGAVPGVILAISMLIVPETPRWLVEHGRDEQAKKLLSRNRSEQQADEEIKEIKDVSAEQGRFGVRNLIGDRVRPLLIIGVTMAIMQQLIGINTVIYYGSTILGFAGLSISSSIAQAVFIGLVNFVFAIVAVFLLDRVGRRAPLLIGTAGSVIGLIVLGWYFDMGDEIPAREPVDRPGGDDVLHRDVRDQPRPDLLGDDRRDLPAPGPRQGDGRLHHVQLGVQLHRFVLVPEPGEGDRSGGDVLAVRALRSGGDRVLRLEGARDQEPQPRADRARGAWGASGQRPAAA